MDFPAHLHCKPQRSLEINTNWICATWVNIFHRNLMEMRTPHGANPRGKHPLYACESGKCAGFDRKKRAMCGCWGNAIQSDLSLVMTKYFLFAAGEGGNKARKGEIFARLAILFYARCSLIDLLPATTLRENTWSSGDRLQARYLPVCVCYPPPTKESGNFNRRLLGNSLKVLLILSAGTWIWSNITLCLQRKFFDAKFPSLSAYFVLWAAAQWPRGNSQNVISCQQAEKRTALV